MLVIAAPVRATQPVKQDLITENIDAFVLDPGYQGDKCQYGEKEKITTIYF